ncbi:hypothetical protein [Microcystis aeruginosa]|nr:hypothetical protein [Microcystis aeruginosa]
MKFPHFPISPLPHFPTSPRNAHEVVSPLPPTPHTLHPTPHFPHP